jgi:RNA polymerase sigma-70 factor (ECF subfamily)
MADDDAPSPESAADLSRFEDRLHGVLASLKPVYRAAFELAVLKQKAYSEIAHEQGWTLAQVKTNVHRARKQVIAALSDLLGPRPEMQP